MLAYLGWIVAAFLGGFLLAYGLRMKHRSLREHFSRVESFRGRSYLEILMIASTRPGTVTHCTDGTTQMTWQDDDYTITLSFDAHGQCLGVVDEHE